MPSLVRLGFDSAMGKCSRIADGGTGQGQLENCSSNILYTCNHKIKSTNYVWQTSNKQITSEAEILFGASRCIATIVFSVFFNNSCRCIISSWLSSCIKFCIIRSLFILLLPRDSSQRLRFTGSKYRSVGILVSAIWNWAVRLTTNVHKQIVQNSWMYHNNQTNQTSGMRRLTCTVQNENRHTYYRAVPIFSYCACFSTTKYRNVGVLFSTIWRCMFRLMKSVHNSKKLQWIVTI